MSTTSLVPLFGRNYSLTITTTGGEVIEVSSSSFEPEALNFRFEAHCTALADRWFCDIEIFNLNNATTAIVVQQGSKVEISAGYQVGSNYGLVWAGVVLWSEFTKKDVVDHVLTLQSVAAMPILQNNFVNFATGPFQKQSQLMLAMAQRATTPFTLFDPGNQLDAVTPGTLPRPVVFFGQPQHYLDQACRQANTGYFVGFDGVANVTQLAVQSTVPLVTYASPLPTGSTATPDPSVSYSIVGTPKQILVTDALFGVSFKVLMDARIKITNPPMVVKIDNSVLIEQARQSFGAPPPVLSQDGIYAVVDVSHIGDSRGNAWYSEVTAVNLIGDQLGLPSAIEKDNSYISVNQGGS
jgi:hypothetical protein